MLENGYIKAFRALKRWGWYKDSPTKDIWLHILLSANYDTQIFKGRQIDRGQLVTSYPSLSEETGLSVQNVRTAIKHLKQTGEITVQSTRDCSIITVPKFDDYQSDANSQLTDNQQAANSPLTGCQQASNRLLTTMEESKKAKKQESKKNTPLPPLDDFAEELQAKISDWIAYKQERREGYKPTGMKSLLTTIRKHADESGDAAVIALIDECMAAGWKGIIWDRLTDKRGKPQGGSFADVTGDW